MSIHDGHRQRLKNRFRQEGLDKFDEIQVLELLLFYAIPQKDTNPLAHRLLDHFGSLAQVLEAPAVELEKISGVGTNAATLLTLTTALARYYMVNRTAQNTVLTSLEKCGAYLLPILWAGGTKRCFCCVWMPSARFWAVRKWGKAASILPVFLSGGSWKWPLA